MSVPQTPRSSVPDLTGTWWKHKRDGHRIQLTGRVDDVRFVAHRQRRDGWSHTYRVSVFVLHGQYRQVTAPRVRKKVSVTPPE